MSTKKIEIGSLLYHNTDKSQLNFNSERENLVYFGLSPDVISFVGGSGFRHTFQVIDDLGPARTYHNNQALGIDHYNGWVSMPCSLACERLQLIDTTPEPE